MSDHIADCHGLFRITQGIFLSNTDYHLLLLKHKSGKWLLPGGRLNVGEDWLSGIKREVFEETSINDFLITGISEVDTWQRGDESYYGIFFIGKIEDQKIKLSDEHIAYKWIKNVEELNELEMWSDALKDRVIRFLRFF